MFSPGKHFFRVCLFIIVSLLLNLAGCRANKEISHAEEVKIVPPNIHPRLVFTREELPELQQKVKEGVPKFAFDRILAAANSYVDPQCGSEALNERIKINSQNIAKANDASYTTLHCTALALAYQITRNRNYGEMAKNMYLNLLEKSEKGGTIYKDYEIFTYLCLMYDWTYELMTAAEQEKARNYFRNYFRVQDEKAKKSDDVIWYISGGGKNNYRNYQLGDLMSGGDRALIAMAFEGENVCPPDYFAKALNSMKCFLDAYGWGYGIHEDGAMQRGTTYGKIATEQYMVCLRALKRRGIDFFTSTNFRATPAWYAYELLPGGRCANNLGDANHQDCLLFGFPDNPLTGWFWERQGPKTEEAIESEARHHRILKLIQIILWYPPPKAVHPKEVLNPVKYFPHVGLVYFRTGWDEDDVVMSFQTRTFHDHYQADVTHFTLYGYGNSFAVDCGYGVNETNTHNIILVDGKGQAPTTDQFGQIMEFMDSKFASYAIGDARPAYEEAITYGHRYVTPKKESWNPLFRAERYILFMHGPEAPSYFVMYDDIDKCGHKKKYEWLLHTKPGNVIRCTGRTARIEEGFTGDYLWNRGEKDQKIDQKKLSVGYKFKVIEEGDYTLWILLRTREQRGHYDNFGVQIDGKGGVWYRILEGGADSWQWKPFLKCQFNVVEKNREKYVFHLQPGEHELKVNHVYDWPGTCLGALLLAKDPNYIPTLDDMGEKGDILLKPKDAFEMNLPWKVYQDEKKGVLDIHFIQPEDVELVKGVYTYEPFYGRLKTDLPLLSAVANKIRPYYTVVLYPHKAGMEKLSITNLNCKVGSGKRASVLASYGKAAKIEWKNATDYLAFGNDDGLKDCQEMDTDAIIAGVRRKKDDGSLSYILIRGKKLVFSEDRKLELVNVEKTDVSLVWSDRELQIFATGKSEIKAYAPGVKKVKLNGKEYKYKKDGNYVGIEYDPGYFTISIDQKRK